MSELQRRSLAEAAGLEEILDLAVAEGASDLLLQEGEPVMLRIAGRMLPLSLENLDRGQLAPLIGQFIPEAAARAFEDNGSADFAIQRENERWRVALYQQRGASGANFRYIPHSVPSIEDWGLPRILASVFELHDGLVFVTGATGSGKSSTLAALLRGILEARPVHAVSIEDPIEYILPAGQGVVSQREVGIDLPSFAEGLRAALRQQADVLLVGEVRDRETANTALNAAETGSLVLSSLHTRSAPETLTRLMEMFPQEEKRRVHGQLSRVLKAIFSQMLVPRRDGKGLIAAVEVLRTSPPVQQLLERGDIGGLAEEIERSVSFHHMQSMNQSLAALVLLEMVSLEEAKRRSPSPDDLDLLIRSCALVPMKDDPMADSFSDFSRIAELMELKEAHEQELIRHQETENQLKDKLLAAQRKIEEQEADLHDHRQIRSALEKQLSDRRDEFHAAREKLDLAVRRLQMQSGKLRELTESKPLWKRLLRIG